MILCNKDTLNRSYYSTESDAFFASGQPSSSQHPQLTGRFDYMSFRTAPHATLPGDRGTFYSMADQAKHDQAGYISPEELAANMSNMNLSTSGPTFSTDAASSHTSGSRNPLSPGGVVNHSFPSQPTMASYPSGPMPIGFTQMQNPYAHGHFHQEQQAEGPEQQGQLSVGSGSYQQPLYVGDLSLNFSTIPPEHRDDENRFGFLGMGDDATAEHGAMSATQMQANLFADSQPWSGHVAQHPSAAVAIQHMPYQPPGNEFQPAYWSEPDALSASYALPGQPHYWGDNERGTTNAPQVPYENAGYGFQYPPPMAPAPYSVAPSGGSSHQSQVPPRSSVPSQMAGGHVTAEERNDVVIPGQDSLPEAQDEVEGGPHLPIPVHLGYSTNSTLVDEQASIEVDDPEQPKRKLRFHLRLVLRESTLNTQITATLLRYEHILHDRGSSELQSAAFASRELPGEKRDRHFVPKLQRVAGEMWAQFNNDFPDSYFNATQAGRFLNQDVIGGVLLSFVETWNEMLKPAATAQTGPAF
ncbi:hypothetical protein QFC24_006743 [Naganishia onofrii]|uniref:Uncharacterized protein n=1 Tax=Naganishia onofrii TaxID=1851511 RepID=A0ACC2WYW1_9TREE|nr:hypothetical protein QFC24_006743 [Naganishia onofrii]